MAFSPEASAVVERAMAAYLTSRGQNNGAPAAVADTVVCVALGHTMGIHDGHMLSNRKELSMCERASVEKEAIPR